MYGGLFSPFQPIVIYTALMAFGSKVDFIFVSVIMKDNYNNYTIALGLYQMLTREHISVLHTILCRCSDNINAITFLF